jgi:serine/threonine protein kinase
LEQACELKLKCHVAPSRTLKEFEGSAAGIGAYHVGTCSEESSDPSDVSLLAERHLPLEDYEIDSCPLGRGSAACVYYACRRDHSRDFQASGTCCPSEVALKVFHASRPSVNETDLSSLRKEVSILTCIQKHPNIIACYGVCLMTEGICFQEDSLPHWAIQLEYCGDGDLHSAVEKQRFHENEALDLMVDVLKGLAHMHKSGFVHRDLKPENVLLAENGIAKLADFGISASLSDSIAMDKRCGSPGYVAPEVVMKKPYDIKIDSFSAGSLLHFLISGKAAFFGSTTESVLYKTVRCAVNFRKSLRLECLSDQCKDFMKKLLEKEPDQRPSASEGLQLLSEILVNNSTAHSAKLKEGLLEDIHSSTLTDGSTCYRGSSDKDCLSPRTSTQLRTSFRGGAWRYTSFGITAQEDPSDEPPQYPSDEPPDDITLLSEYAPQRPSGQEPSGRSPIVHMRRGKRSTCDYGAALE